MKNLSGKFIQVFDGVQVNANHFNAFRPVVRKLSRREDEPKMFAREDAELEGQELDELFEHDLELDLNLLEFEEWEINDLD